MDVIVTPGRARSAAPTADPNGRGPRGVRFAVAVGLGLVVAVGTGGGVAAAWDSPATAVTSCAPDLRHWQATITVSADGASAYTLTSASLDVMRWSPDAALTGMAAGTVLTPGATMTADATGLPLSSAGAVVSYTGTYADGRVETNTITLSRPVTSCDEAATTTTVAVSTTTAPSTTTATTTATTTTTTTTGTGGDTEDTTTTTAGSGPTTTEGSDVLGGGETAPTVGPRLAATGTGSARSLTPIAFALVAAGVALTALALALRRSDRST